MVKQKGIKPVFACLYYYCIGLTGVYPAYAVGVLSFRHARQAGTLPFYSLEYNLSSAIAYRAFFIN